MWRTRDPEVYGQVILRRTSPAHGRYVRRTECSGDQEKMGVRSEQRLPSWRHHSPAWKFIRPQQSVAFTTRLGLVLELFASELLSAVGEVPAKITMYAISLRISLPPHWRPCVLPVTPRQGRKTMCPCRTCLPTCLPMILRSFLTSWIDFSTLAVISRPPYRAPRLPTRTASEQHVVDRAGRSPPRPSVDRGQPHDPVPDVVVSPNDVVYFVGMRGSTSFPCPLGDVVSHPFGGVDLRVVMHSQWPWVSCGRVPCALDEIFAVGFNVYLIYVMHIMAFQVNSL